MSQTTTPDRRGSSGNYYESLNDNNDNHDNDNTTNGSSASGNGDVHDASSSSFDDDDEDDDPDESLLVSPAPFMRWRASEDNTIDVDNSQLVCNNNNNDDDEELIGGATSVALAMELAHGGRNNNNNNSNDNNESNNNNESDSNNESNNNSSSSSSPPVTPTRTGDNNNNNKLPSSEIKTPGPGAKFSYASAMDQLEELVPSAMKKEAPSQQQQQYNQQQYHTQHPLLTSSVFRHPCIRHENQNEDSNLELKRGFPLNNDDDDDTPTAADDDAAAACYDEDDAPTNTIAKLTTNWNGSDHDAAKTIVIRENCSNSNHNHDNNGDDGDDANLSLDSVNLMMKLVEEVGGNDGDDGDDDDANHGSSSNENNNQVGTTTSQEEEAIVFHEEEEEEQDAMIAKLTTNEVHEEKAEECEEMLFGVSELSPPIHDGVSSSSRSKPDKETFISSDDQNNIFFVNGWGDDKGNDNDNDDDDDDDDDDDALNSTQQMQDGENHGNAGVEKDDMPPLLPNDDEYNHVGTEQALNKSCPSTSMDSEEGCNISHVDDLSTSAQEDSPAGKRDGQASSKQKDSPVGLCDGSTNSDNNANSFREQDENNSHLHRYGIEKKLSEKSQAMYGDEHANIIRETTNSQWNKSESEDPVEEFDTDASNEKECWNSNMQSMEEKVLLSESKPIIHEGCSTAKNSDDGIYFPDGANEQSESTNNGLEIKMSTSKRVGHKEVNDATLTDSYWNLSTDGESALNLSSESIQCNVILDVENNNIESETKWEDCDVVAENRNDAKLSIHDDSSQEVEPFIEKEAIATKPRAKNPILSPHLDSACLESSNLDDSVLVPPVNFAHCLSPISKSSSPHNCDDAPQSSHLTIDESLAHFDEADKCNYSGVKDQADPQTRSSEDGKCDAFKSTQLRPGSPNETNDIVYYDQITQHQEHVFCEPQNHSPPRHAVEEGVITEKASIFDVLSRPIPEIADSNFPIHDAPYKTHDIPLEMDTCLVEETLLCGTEQLCDDEEYYYADKPTQDSCEKSETLSSTHLRSIDDADANSIDKGNKRKSLDDLTSFQKDFDSTSNAFLEKLRGAAENRRREVTRCRYSLERKEQLILEKKEVASDLPTVCEEPKPSPRLSVPSSCPSKKIEGLDPYKPFKAKPLPASALDTGNKGQRGIRIAERRVSTAPSALRFGTCRRESSASTAHIRKKAVEVPTRKSLAPGENPYIPFKARPMPGAAYSTNSTRPSTDSVQSLGAKRKNICQSETNTKSAAALNAKPPKRLLSGKAASVVKETKHQQRLKEEEAILRRKSSFKARPLPVTVSRRSHEQSMVDDLVGVDILSASCKENFVNASSCQEHENTLQKKRQSITGPFVPRSTLRAEKRAEFEAERVQREKKNQEDQVKRRIDLIDKTTAEINDLKNFIR